MMLFGLLAVLAIACGAMLVIFSFVEPPAQLMWVRDIEWSYLTSYVPGGAQRFVIGIAIALGVPFLLFGVLSNHL